MVVSINYSGRLGNHFFQYCAAYIFAKKFGFKIISETPENIFGLPILTGDFVELPIIDVTDDNFLQLLNSQRLDFLHYRFVGYYQLKEFILSYRNEIKKLFSLRYNDVENDLVFVHYRIGDILGLRQTIPIEYYIRALESINPKGGFISSDTPEHHNVILISEKFNLEIYNKPPLETIDFAKNFNNLILSEGTFSWWIGFLSNTENVIYNKRSRFWHGDIFVIPEWKYLSYDWDSSCIVNNHELICNKIINLKNND